MRYQPTVGSDEELYRLAQALSAPQPFIQLATTYAPPAKPQEGMIMQADGTRWNPGSGAGFYGYIGGAWHFLG